MFGYEFANPEYFWLLLVILPMVVWYVFKERNSHADLQFSSISFFKTLKRGNRIWLRHVLFALRVLAIAFLIFALARPQSDNSWQTYNSEGIDIMLALDISGSMLARDLNPNRLVQAQTAIKDTIDLLEGDRAALVAFAGSTVVMAPLTTDYAFLRRAYAPPQTGECEQGTP